MQLTETITWRPVGDGLPDAELTVLLALEDGETLRGFLDGQRADGSPIWRDLTAVELTAVPVTHWADMPLGPRRNATPPSAA